MKDNNPRQLVKGFTLDTVGTKICDDGLAVYKYDHGGWLLRLSVPDVPRLIVRGSDVDKHASKQGFQLPGRPLLPWPLLRSLSLTQDRQVPAITFDIYLHKDHQHLTVKKLKIRRCFFKSLAQLDFKRADQLLRHKQAKQDWLMKQLRSAYELADSLKEHRHHPDPSSWQELGGGWYLDHSGQPVKLWSKPNKTMSDHMLEELLIYANKVVANWCYRRRIKVIYKNQRNRLEVTSTEVKDSKIACKEIASKPIFSPHSLGHSGYGFRNYLSVSSPLRAYDNQVNLRSIISSLDNQTVYQQTELVNLCRLLNQHWQQSYKCNLLECFCREFHIIMQWRLKVLKKRSIVTGSLKKGSLVVEETVSDYNESTAREIVANKLFAQVNGFI